MRPIIRCGLLFWRLVRTSSQNSGQYRAKQRMVTIVFSFPGLLGRLSSTSASVIATTHGYCGVRSFQQQTISALFHVERFSRIERR
ncbi:MAG TPA: hypothetical protein VH370_05945 [Humisphaera sp.]|jgi:hypothetical protein|nr:hypothetical protein [Humisphaera sp.]